LEKDNGQRCNTSSSPSPTMAHSKDVDPFTGGLTPEIGSLMTPYDFAYRRRLPYTPRSTENELSIIQEARRRLSRPSVSRDGGSQDRNLITPPHGRSFARAGGSRAVKAVINGAQRGARRKSSKTLSIVTMFKNQLRLKVRLMNAFFCELRKVAIYDRLTSSVLEQLALVVPLQSMLTPMSVDTNQFLLSRL
jgi:hypothetical protein